MALGVLLISFAQRAQAQTQIKANAAYWLVGIINVSAETKVSPKFTINGDVVYSPWKSVNGRHMQLCQVIPELRFYPKGSFEKFYVGGYAAADWFNVTKWNYTKANGKFDSYQKGWGYSFGMVVGFQTSISQRWRLDIYAGGGYVHSTYRGYYKSTGEKYVGRNGSGEWLPYKAGVAFAYRLGK